MAKKHALETAISTGEAPDSAETYRVGLLLLGERVDALLDLRQQLRVVGLAHNGESGDFKWRFLSSQEASERESRTGGQRRRKANGREQRGRATELGGPRNERERAGGASATRRVDLLRMIRSVRRQDIRT